MGLLTTSLQGVQGKEDPDLDQTGPDPTGLSLPTTHQVVQGREGPVLDRTDISLRDLSLLSLGHWNYPIELPPVTYFDAKDLTEHFLPEIQYEQGRSVTSSAVHGNLKFCGRLAPWLSFERDVHTIFMEVFNTWNPTTSKKLHVVLSHPGENTISNEHYLCGEEISSSGRYVQHVLHVMTAVGYDLGFKLRFGDWYTSYIHKQASSTQKKSGAKPTTSKQKSRAQKEFIAEPNPSDAKPNTRNEKIIPDYALLAEEPEGRAAYARALGEAKSPYGPHDFQGWIEDTYRSDDEKFRKLLGQVAKYMYRSELKYAFVTNYITTVFLNLRDYFLALEDSSVNPLYRDVFFEDDAASAGIVRSKSARSRRPWASQKDEDEIVSTVTKADGTPKAVLRRVVLPQIDKARHMFPKYGMPQRGDTVVMAYMEVSAPSVPPTKPRDAKEVRVRASSESVPERHHRRCHSEQPRAWREPSASLWTLLEE
ncbi:predicted protein [Paecilomyces variotii No. 5]|uniref:Uncharacterized protein n=1 Tax=Byssochlamys spectabilis (strain No. 5 / NBRC 109023) TaxID=1356009 RepID=V5I0U4_BYSSN|nr:predicted protein [Paecilomyces variotii No. 5]